MTATLVTLDPNTLAAVPTVIGKPFDPTRDPIQLLQDRPERWESLRRRGVVGSADRGISWTEARQRIAADAALDGARTDLGAGALDRLAVDFDPRGLMHVAKTGQRGGVLVPMSQPIPLRAHAFRQLAARAAAPAGYLARLPAGLARACLMHGLSVSDGEKTGLIRLARGEARAIVTDTYGIADDGALLDAVERELEDRALLDGVRVVALAVGGRTVLRLMLPIDAEAKGRPGDRLVGMLDIRNGELGNASVEVRGGTYRLICTNGLVAPIGTEDVRRIRHVGNGDRLREKVRDAIPAAIDAAQATTNLLREATQRIVGAAAEAFSGLRLFGATAALVTAAQDSYAAEVGLTLPADATGRKTILEHMGDVTAWDVVNAATDAAQRLGVEARLDAEGAAGAYLRRTMGA